MFGLRTPTAGRCSASPTGRPPATWPFHGADPDLRHDWGGQGHGINAVAMHLAASHDAVGCVELLLDRGADATIVDGAHGSTPLGWAEFGGAPSTTALLRERWVP